MIKIRITETKKIINLISSLILFRIYTIYYSNVKQIYLYIHSVEYYRSLWRLFVESNYVFRLQIYGNFQTYCPVRHCCKLISSILRTAL